MDRFWLFFCFLLLTKLAHSGEKNTKQWRKVERTPKIAMHKRALQLAARSMLWSILDTGALELIRARTAEAGDQVEQPKNSEDLIDVCVCVLGSQ